MASVILQQKRQQLQQLVETGQEEVGVEEEVKMVFSNGGEGQLLGLCYDIVATEV